VNAATVSALLMTLPRTGRLLTPLTVALGDTDVETCISVYVAARIASPPPTCTWTTNDDLRLCWRCHAAVIGVS